MKLLYRGEKYIDESFPDYLMRLAYWNGFRDLKNFSNNLRIFYRERYVAASPIETDNPYDHFDFYDSHLSLLLFECKYALEVVLKRNFCLEEFHLSPHTKGASLYKIDICRACWQERSYVRFYWRLNLFGVCHKHGTKFESIEMVSYHPNEERIGLMQSKDAGSILDSYWTIRKFRHVIENTEISFKSLSIETDNLVGEWYLWREVVLFLKCRFKVEFQFGRVDELLELDILCVLDLLDRLELVISMLVNKSDTNEKLIKIVSLIFMIRCDVFRYHVESFVSWVSAQAYSVNPLFEVYIFGVSANLFCRNYSLKQEVINPVNFSNLNERMICQFIIDSGIFCESELQNMYTGGKYTSLRGESSRGCVPGTSRSYKGYMDVVEENIFCGDPLPRSSLEI